MHSFAVWRLAWWRRFGKGIATSFARWWLKDEIAEIRRAHSEGLKKTNQELQITLLTLRLHCTNSMKLR